MQKFIIVFISMILLSGCAKVRNLDQLLTLKGLAEEQEELGEYIEGQDEKFQLVLDEAKAGTLNQYSNSRKIRRTFGDPIYERAVTQDDQEMTVWLYRSSTDFFGSAKVYLYFDTDGNLVKSRYVEGKDGEIKQEAETKDGLQEI